MRRIHIVPLAVLASLSASACLTEETKCPTGHVRMRSLCVEIDGEEDAGDKMDGAVEGPDAGDKPQGDGSTSDSGYSLDASDAGTDAAPPMVPPVCYLDFDHDGAGAGDEVDCDDPFADLPDASWVDASSSDAGDATLEDATAPDASPDGAVDAAAPDAAAADAGGMPALPAVVHRNDDCDDRDPKRAPTLKELCDGIDNNCNTDIDDNAKNACGGTCTRVLDHAPGDICDNGLLGACAKPGKYICQGDTDVVCNAPKPTGSTELCADGIDNDCDGVIDEPDAPGAPLWYQDCDGDGYAAGTTGSRQSCTKPDKLGDCTWTHVLPQPTTRTNWDCNDGSAAYKPGASYGTPPSGFTSWDLNCDGPSTPHPDPASESLLFICPDSVITRLNNGNRYCDDSPEGVVQNCYLWMGSDGRFIYGAPTTKCPDSNTYRIAFGPPPVIDPWGFNLHGSRHATTCRNALPTRNPRSATHQPARAGKTTPGAFYCTANAVPPVWPCR